MATTNNLSHPYLHSLDKEGSRSFLSLRQQSERLAFASSTAGPPDAVYIHVTIYRCIITNNERKCRGEIKTSGCDVSSDKKKRGNKRTRDIDTSIARNG